MPNIRPPTWLINHRARKIRSIRDNQFEQDYKWGKFRKKLLEGLAGDGPITPEVWQEAENYWRAGVGDLVRYFPTEKAENLFITEQLENGILEEG
jgi:hypothetical protein